MFCTSCTSSTVGLNDSIKSLAFYIVYPVDLLMLDLNLVSDMLAGSFLLPGLSNAGFQHHNRHLLVLSIDHLMVPMLQCIENNQLMMAFQNLNQQKKMTFHY